MPNAITSKKGAKFPIARRSAMDAGVVKKPLVVPDTEKLDKNAGLQKGVAVGSKDYTDVTRMGPAGGNPAGISFALPGMQGRKFIGAGGALFDTKDESRTSRFQARAGEAVKELQTEALMGPRWQGHDGATDPWHTARLASVFAPPTKTAGQEGGVGDDEDLSTRLPSRSGRGFGSRRRTAQDDIGDQYGSTSFIPMPTGVTATTPYAVDNWNYPTPKSPLSSGFSILNPPV